MLGLTKPGRTRVKEDWRRKVASGWRGGEETACALCGADLRRYEVQGRFELAEGGSYQTCIECFEREVKVRLHLLHSRGCRKASLLDVKRNTCRGMWQILPQAPWISPISLEDKPQ